MTQTVFLFKTETCVLTSRMEQALDTNEHRVVWRITRRKPMRQGGGSWAYPPLEGVVGEAGFEGISKYITRRQNMVTQYIATLPFLDLCERLLGG